MEFIKKITDFLRRNEWRLLWLSIGAYFIIFSLIGLFKYFNFGYNGLDLAIYNQVFYNSVHGQLFGLTIHPSSYLGDHFELFIVLLLPLYALFKHPVSLLILQSLFLALPAWPLFLIAKNVLAKPWPLLVAGLWLINPFVQNINLFEFHLLPFAIFFLCWAFYFYQKNRFFAFLIFCFLALLVREDVALVIFMFAPLAWLEKKEKKWLIWPAVISIVWFVLAMKVIDHFTPGGSYKFLYYYNWLGNTPLNMAINFFLKPLNTLRYIFTLNNILFTLVLFLPFGYLNLIKPRYLLPALPIYLQLILGGSSNSLINLKIHYTSLLLPWLFITLIFSLKELNDKNSKIKSVRFFQKYQGLALVILLASAVYGCLTLGPLVGAANKIIKPTDTAEVKQLKNEFLSEIPRLESVAASYEFLTDLSGREKVYSLHYAFIGKKQFTNLDYRLPQDTEALLFNFDDLLTYSVQFPNSREWQALYTGGDDNLRKLIAERGFKAVKVADSLALFKQTDAPGEELYQITKELPKIEQPQNVEFKNGLRFLGYSKGENLQELGQKYNLLPISLYFTAEKPIDKDYQLKFIIKNKNGLPTEARALARAKVEQIAQQKIYPLAYGLYPTSNWQPGEIVKTNYWFLLPKELPGGEYSLEIQLVNLEGFLTLDDTRSAVLNITKENALTPAIFLGQASINRP
ncbi:MAG: DUF2079 domain-containing protein [Candidatus Komeilibacteria bacterium]|nr:DUF2079 domain-containing protein [Candidatus Komeilibacteria bacterium]